MFFLACYLSILLFRWFIVLIPNFTDVKLMNNVVMKTKLVLYE